MASFNGFFLNMTNIRVESLKLKSVIKPYSNLSRFLDNFFIFFNCIRTEKDNNIVNGLMKVSVDIPELISEYKNF